MIYPAAYRIFFGSMWQENKNAVFEPLRILGMSYK